MCKLHSISGHTSPATLPRISLTKNPNNPKNLWIFIQQSLISHEFVSSIPVNRIICTVCFNSMKAYTILRLYIIVTPSNLRVLVLNWWAWTKIISHTISGIRDRNLLLLTYKMTRY